MESNSVQRLWDEIQRRLTSVSNTPSPKPEPPKVEETPPPADNSDNGAAEKPENSAQQGSKWNLSPNNPLRKYPRADEVWKTYRSTHTHVALGKAMAKRNSRELWDLILVAIDNGFLKQTGACTNSETLTTDLGLQAACTKKKVLGKPKKA